MMDISRIYYTSNIPYITSQFIREYDIKKANISILLSKGVIDTNQYNFLYNTDRMTRQITIGKMIRDNPKIGNILKEGINEVVYKFLEINNISENDILSRKNDAIFIINKIPSITKFGNIEFVNKNIYTSYINLNSIEIYYCLDRINNLEKIDIKGISDDKLVLHENYFINFLCEYFYRVENSLPEDTIKWFKEFFISYLSNSLDEGYYRTFDSMSVINTTRLGMYSYNISGYTLPSEIIDISYNLSLLRLLYRYLLEIKFGRR